MVPPQHVLLCLISAFFIAGSISVFLSQTAAMKFLGAGLRLRKACGILVILGGFYLLYTAR